MKNEVINKDVFRLPSGTVSVAEEKIQGKKTGGSSISIKYFLIVALTLMLGMVLSVMLFFRIDNIQVEGSEFYASQDIIEALDIRMGNNLFLTNLLNSNEKLSQTMPYVQSYKLKSRLPGTLIVSVQEAQVACVAKTDVGYAVLSDDAKVLEHVSAQPKNITVLNGLDILDAAPGHVIMTDNEEDLYILKDILKALRKSGLKGVDSVDMTDTINIYLYYENRLRIEIGTVADVENKLARVSEVLKKLDKSDRGRLDVTIDERVSFIPLRDGEKLYKDVKKYQSNRDDDQDKSSDVISSMPNSQTQPGDSSQAGSNGRSDEGAQGSSDQSSDSDGSAHSQPEL